MLNRLFLALAVSFPLWLAMPAGASKAPPTIDDVDGVTFSVRAKGFNDDLNGNKTKSDVTITMTFTKTGAQTLTISGVFGGMSDQAFYVNGYLMQSANSGEPLPEFGSVTHAVVTGKPGKLRLKGLLVLYDAPPGFAALRVQKLSGKQLP